VVVIKKIQNMPKTKSEFLEIKKSMILYLEYAKKKNKILGEFFYGV
jgi:hypothetical protein